MYVTSTGKTIKEAREKCCKLAEKIVLPKVFYRNDIGKKFEVEDYKKGHYPGAINVPMQEKGNIEDVFNYNKLKELNLIKNV
jgi:hypothetical protein